MESMLEQALQEAQETAIAKVKVRKPRKPKTTSLGALGEPQTKSLGQAFEEADQDGTDEAPPELRRITVSESLVKKQLAGAVEVTAPPKKVRKPKKEESVTKPKTKKAPSKGKAPKRRKATPAQLKAAKQKLPRRDWVKDIANFRKAKHNNLRIVMGSPGSAQVTKVRLEEWDGFKGLVAFTRGANLFISKLKLDDAKAAAKKAGFA